MGKKYFVPVKPVTIGVLEVFRFSKDNEWAIGYRFDANDKRHLSYKKARLYPSQYEAQAALDELAKAEKLEAVDERL